MKKIIRKVLKEALGVPEGNVGSAKELYDLILEEMRGIDFDSMEEEYYIQIPNSFYINDYEIDGVNFTMEIVEYSGIDEVDVASFGYVPATTNLTNKKGIKLVHGFGDGVDIKCVLVVPEHDWEFKDVYDFFVKNKVLVTKNLSHELMHSYDMYKKQERSVYKTAMYHTYSKMSLGIKPIDNFIHNLYFVHSIENIVRPSELASEMDLRGITQKEFINFLNDNDVYTKLREISNFSVENLKNDLKPYISQIDKILKGLNQPTNIPVDEKIDNFLRIVYVSLSNMKLSMVNRILNAPFMGKITNNLHLDLQKYMNDTVKKITRFPSHKEFFEYEEKMFRYTAKKLMKKLSKLYAITKTNESSIVNWDLHQKINKDKLEGFTNEINYPKNK
jgi:hypothetical protein